MARPLPRDTQDDKVIHRPRQEVKDTVEMIDGKRNKGDDVYRRNHNEMHGGKDNPGRRQVLGTDEASSTWSSGRNVKEP